MHNKVNKSKPTKLSQAMNYKADKSKQASKQATYEQQSQRGRNPKYDWK